MPDFIDMEKRQELIRSHPVFTNLTDSETAELAAMLVEKEFSAGDTIVTEGDLVESVFFIVKGMAEVRRITIHDGKTHVASIARLRVGESIGLNETGFYALGGVRTATVVATTDMLLLCLSVATFHGFALMHHHVNEVMRKNAASFLRLKV